MGTPADAVRAFGFLGLLGLLGPLACSSPTRAPVKEDPARPRLVIRPIQVESVDVLVMESFPPQVSAHVRGYLGDGCSSLHSVTQRRSGNTVTLEILGQRPADAICIQLAKGYDEVIRLQGEFPPGEYLLRINSVEKVFTTE